jgi:hypothetical protein
MTRSKKDTELLKRLGYDPDDPAYSIENFGDDDDEVTATETNAADVAVEFDKYSDEELLQALDIMRQRIDEATDFLEAIIKYLVNKPKP